MNSVNDYLIEIMGRLSSIEAKQDSMRYALEVHSEQDRQLKAEVDDIRLVVTKGQAQISLIKWLVGLGVALTAAVAKFVR